MVIPLKDRDFNVRWSKNSRRALASKPLAKRTARNRRRRQLARSELTTPDPGVFGAPDSSFARGRRIQAAAGRPEEAERTFEVAERIVRTIFLNSPTLNARRAVIAGMSEVWIKHFSLMARMNDPAKAYLVIEEARGRTAADRPQTRDQKLANRTPEMAAAERRLASLQMRLLDAENPDDRQTLSAELTEVERQLSPPHGEPLAISPDAHLSVGELQAELGLDEVVLEYVLSEPASYCLWVTREHADIAQLPSRGTIEALVEHYLGAVKGQGSAKDEGQALFSAVLEPIHAYGKKDRLLVIPDGALHRIPFAGLADKTGAYVINSHAVSYAPSGGVLTLLRRQPQVADRLLLAVGSVPYQERSPQSRLPFGRVGLFFRGLSSLTRDALAPLPSTGDEVRAVSEIVASNKAVILVNERATETNFKNEVAHSFRIVHLAVHGFADKTYPDRAGLVFAADPNAHEDGLLQVREIRRLPLRNTSLVTLSACDTNVGRIEGEEGVSSIVSAFLYAGARSAVATFWVVEKIRNHQNPNFGFNASTEQYEDLVNAGVIDPTKVTRTALQNAASIASLMLTTEAMICAVVEEPGQ